MSGVYNYQVKPHMSAQERDRLRIERLKARNEDRVKRLLNAKLRVYGRDVDSHNEQARVKAERAKEERARKLYYEQKRVEEANILERMTQERETQNKKDLRDLAAYHKAQQLMKETRDAEELAYYKGDGGKAVREQNTLFMKFHGEDLGKNQRVKMQQEQQRQWIIQQMQAKEQQRKKAVDLAHRYVNFTETTGGHCKAAELEGANARVARNHEVQAYNKALEMAKRRKADQRRAYEEQMSEKEIAFAKGSKLLNEDASTTYATGNPNRRVPYHFKGFSTEERQEIRNTQARQVEAKREAKERELEIEREHVRQQENFRRQLILMERERMDRQIAEDQELAHYHKSQEVEANIRKENFKKKVYQNPVRPEFFDQFEKSCR